MGRIKFHFFLHGIHWDDTTLTVLEGLQSCLSAGFIKYYVEVVFLGPTVYVENLRPGE